MNDHMEHIPEKILDWIEKYPFEQLNPAQQKEVLQYLGADEYAEMHEAALLLHKTGHAEPLPGRHVQEKLLQHFDTLYPKKQKRNIFLFTPLPLWQVAASWLLLGICITLFFRNTHKEPAVALQTIHDTVYTTKPAQTITELVHDTIYLVRESIRQSTTPAAHIPATHQPEIAFTDTNTEGPQPRLYPSDIHFLQVKDKDLLLNSKNGTPIRDDSLLKTFEFVRIL